MSDKPRSPFSPPDLSWSVVGAPPYALSDRPGIMVHGSLPIFGRNTSDEMHRIGGQPAVYVWMLAHREEASRVVYVGQTTTLSARTRQHLRAGARISNGRRILLEMREGWDPWVAWRLYSCDCPLDFAEAHLIRELMPEWNRSFGANERGPECDQYCAGLAP